MSDWQIGVFGLGLFAAVFTLFKINERLQRLNDQIENLHDFLASKSSPPFDDYIPPLTDRKRKQG